MIDAKHLPIVLPEVEKYLPTEDGLPPLGNATTWAWDTVNNKVVSNELISPLSEGSGEATIFPLELNTMPGWAGSSWYWMRYMDAQNDTEFASSEALKYWESVDLYIGGSEHATGHLLYSRFWNKFLKDKGFAPTEEPFKKLINQGMILGTSAFVYKLSWSTFSGEDKFGVKLPPIFVSNSLKNNEDALKSEFDKIIKDIFPEKLEVDILGVFASPRHVDVSIVNSSDELDIERFKKSREEYNNALFITEENGKYIVGREVEKMSKSKYNVVTPDDICAEYGADTLRLYEMFLGPLEQAKPWNTAGISGVFGFLKKLWRFLPGFIADLDL